MGKKVSSEDKGAAIFYVKIRFYGENFFGGTFLCSANVEKVMRRLPKQSLAGGGEGVRQVHYRNSSRGSSLPFSVLSKSRSKLTIERLCCSAIAYW